MNKFKKKTRTKAIAASIAILSSAAVVSTGFAAWVISGGESNEVSGTITADSVSNNFHEISFAADGNDNSVFFGGPESQTKTDSMASIWLSNNIGSGENKKAEDLDASFKFTVSGLSSEITKPSDLFSSVVLEETTSGADTTAKYVTYADTDDSNSKKYLAKLPSLTLKDAFDVKPEGGFTTAGIYLTNGVFTQGADNKSGTQEFTCCIRFGWGKAFDGKNPFTYYNEKGVTSTLVSEANAALSALSNLNANFKLTITTK